MMRVSRLTLVLASSTLVLGACRKKPVVAPKTDTAPVAQQQQPTRPTNTTPAARDTMEEYRAKLAATRARLNNTLEALQRDTQELAARRDGLLADIVVLGLRQELVVRLSRHPRPTA
jgi:peptidoglycan-associated lipoprotein